MALEICPDCGKEISSSGGSCPNCGFKKKGFWSGCGQGAAVGCLLALVILLYVAYQLYQWLK